MLVPIRDDSLLPTEEQTCRACHGWETWNGLVPIMPQGWPCANLSTVRAALHRDTRLPF